MAVRKAALKRAAPKSISAAELKKFTAAAVKAAAANVPGKIVVKPSTIGYILREDLGAARNLELATQISNTLQSNARAAGIPLKPSPVVVIRPGIITVGIIAADLNLPIRGL
jgi:hypothetical protein